MASSLLQAVVWEFFGSASLQSKVVTLCFNGSAIAMHYCLNCTQGSLQCDLCYSLDKKTAGGQLGMFVIFIFQTPTCNELSLIPVICNFDLLGWGSLSNDQLQSWSPRTFSMSYGLSLLLCKLKCNKLAYNCYTMYKVHCMQGLCIDNFVRVGGLGVWVSSMRKWTCDF